MIIYSDKLKFTHIHTQRHTKSLLYHLPTHIHNVFLSPAAHQGLGKLPGMKEICSLMAPFACIWWHKTQLELFSAANKDSLWRREKKRSRICVFFYDKMQEGVSCLLIVSRWIFCISCSQWKSIQVYLLFTFYRVVVLWILWIRHLVVKYRIFMFHIC